MYPEIPALSFISAVLTLAPLSWYFHAHNIAAVAIGMWLSMANISYAVDALVWAESADIRAPVWCDISTSLITGSRLALPVACLSICIHLERLAYFSQNSSFYSKYRHILMCFGLPIVYIALHLVVQPRRFDLFYGFGCRPATYPTIATIFLVMIPPLLLVVAAFFYAGMAWRHFLVHGVQFYGKRGSISSQARKMYLRLVGMALVEATLSAVLISVTAWDVLSSGMTPMGTMPRHLSEIRVRGADAVTTNTRIVLEIEWSVTVVQSVVFFGLFAFRMEVLRGGWEQIRWFLRLFNRSAVSATFENKTVDQTTTGTSVPTFPTTVVDLSLVVESASTLTRYVGGDAMDKSPPGSESLHPLYHVNIEDAPEDVVISAIAPEMVPLESPSHASAIASSHNSLSSNFDPEQLFIFPEAWPRTPTTIPVCFSRPRSRTFSVAYIPDPKQTRQCQLGIDKVDVDVPFALVWAKHTVHVRSCTMADSFRAFGARNGDLEVSSSCVTLVQETP